MDLIIRGPLGSLLWSGSTNQRVDPHHAHLYLSLPLLPLAVLKHMSYQVVRVTSPESTTPWKGPAPPPPRANQIHSAQRAPSPDGCSFRALTDPTGAVVLGNRSSDNQHISTPQLKLVQQQTPTRLCVISRGPTEVVGRAIALPQPQLLLRYHLQKVCDTL
jgi:hypothetical protein